MHPIRISRRDSKEEIKLKNNTKNMVGVALFTAIVVVLQLLGGGIKAGMFSISLVLVPIVVGSAVYGWKAGAWLGFAFGVAVLLSGDAAAFLAVDVFGTILVVLLKGTLCGLLAGLLYKLLSKANQVIAVFGAAILCPLVNTGVFLIGCRIFFYETVAEWGAALGFENVAAYMFLGLAGVNFLIELGVNIVLAPMIVRLIKMRMK
jgi:thiamine transporter ThiT